MVDMLLSVEPIAPTRLCLMCALRAYSLESLLDCLLCPCCTAAPGATAQAIAQALAQAQATGQSQVRGQRSQL